ncbi:MAG TPA: ABC transporter substrate-binding protein, partial [Micromonosporaceae bacterium]
VYGVASSGIRAYFNTINASGGVNGYTFKVVEEDNQYQPAKAASTARDLVSKGAFVIISEGTPSYDGIKQVAAQLKVPALVAANGDLFKPPPAPNLFGENPPYSGESENLFRFVLQNLKIKKVGLAWENDDVGSPASKNAPGYVQQNGGQLVSSQAISNGTTDYSPFCQKFQAAGAQAVEGFLISTGLAGLQKACAAIGYKPVWVSPFFSFAPEYLALAGSASEGTYIDSYQYSLDSDQPGVTEYKQAMMKYFPKDVESAFAEQGYAFAQAVSDAVSTATTGGKALTQSAFLSGLTINNQQVGLIPGFTYDSTTHQGAAELAIFQVQNGSFVQKTDFQALPAAVAASS